MTTVVIEIDGGNRYVAVQETYEFAAQVLINLAQRSGWEPWEIEKVTVEPPRLLAIQGVPIPVLMSGRQVLHQFRQAMRAVRRPR